MAKKAEAKSGATVGALVSALDRIAPFRLAESWDNVGLQVGDASQSITRTLVTLEMSDDVLREAKRLKVGAVVAHHPLIFRERKSFAEVDPVSRIACALIRANIAFIASHTNLDSTLDGTNGVLLSHAGDVNDVRFLRESPSVPDLAKFAVFVPHTHVDAIIAAIGRAGGGAIGDYSHCTFRVAGTGTFRPLAGANPFVGKVGTLETVEEMRVEAVCPRSKVGALVEEVRRAHPYEEMAHDVLPMEPAHRAKFGLGLVATLAEPTTLGALAKRYGRRVPGATLATVGDPARKVTKIAVCSGAGGEFVRTGRVGGADVLITGEMSHHDAWEARERGIGVILVGHFQSEAIVCAPLAKRLGAELPGVSFIVSESQRDPLGKP